MRRDALIGFLSLAACLALAACKPATPTSAVSPAAKPSAIVVIYLRNDISDGDLDSLFTDVDHLPGVSAVTRVEAKEGLALVSKHAAQFPQAQNGNSSRPLFELTVTDASQAQRVVDQVLRAPYLGSGIPHPAEPTKDVGYLRLVPPSP